MKNAADKLCAIKPQPIGLKRVSCDAMRCAAWRVATCLRFAMRIGREPLQLASGCAGLRASIIISHDKNKAKEFVRKFLRFDCQQQQQPLLINVRPGRGSLSCAGAGRGGKLSSGTEAKSRGRRLSSGGQRPGQVEPAPKSTQRPMSTAASPFPQYTLTTGCARTGD